MQMHRHAGFFSRTILLGIFVLPLIAAAQNRVDAADLAHHPMEASFDSGGQLDLRIRSGEIHIVGTDHDKLTVKAGGEEGSSSTDIHAHFEDFGGTGKLWIEGGPSKNVTITVEVPRNSNLRARITAGDVELNGITGSKDVELHAGQLTIDVGNPADYSHVQASVTTGSIEARPFGEDRGGLFRSFEKSGTGKYRLLAHVGAGQLTLK
jgi:hypothetical protein